VIFVDGKTGKNDQQDRTNMENQGFFQTKRSKTLEDLFFLKQDEILMEDFHRMQAMKETKESLSKVSGIADDEILQKFVDLGIRPETLASLALVPLIEVAWADGSVEKEEKEAVLKAAGHLGFSKDSVDFSLLKQWLSHQPTEDLFHAWEHYMQGLCEVLTAPQKAALKKDLIGHARQVAQASGGFLGINTISKSEQAILDRLNSVFA
jgi:tellurite resistance protein